MSFTAVHFASYEAAKKLLMELSPDKANEEGPGALLRGIRPRILFHTPAAAICWSTYEAGKSFLMRWNDRQKSD
ncbi:unnamed protein product [Calypogeia fissa]